MRKFNAYYYLLFVLLIMGAFASMAQNDYGNTILGVVAFSFAILFVIQLFSSITSADAMKKKNRFELASLVLLSVILGLRIFYIHFLWVEYIYGLAGLTLIGVNVRHLILTWSLYGPKNKTLAYLIAAFFVSVVLYLTSMTLVPFSSRLTEPFGEAAFAILIIFAVGSYLKRDLMVAGEKHSAFTILAQRRDQSIILITLFLLFTAYMGLTKINAIPKMYSNELPQAYFELIKKSESGEAGNKKTSPEEFKNAYDRFVKKNSTD